jgi:acyl-coenzyme A thioesterase PaaI-like protein
LCTKKASNGQVVLAASAALAVFDELSSYAVVIKDKNCRFGVSVFLSTELLHDIPAGSEVIVAVNAVKVGRTLGFIDMKMLDKDNRLVAHGRHIKYLPMGWIWDIFTHPSISPYSFPLLESLSSNEAFNNSYVGRKLGEALLGADNNGIASPGAAASSESAAEVVSSTFEMLDVRPAEVASSGDGDGGGGCAGSSDGYDLNVTPQMCNMMGSLHGGALAMAIESSAAQYKKKKTSPDHRSDITCIEIQYLSAVKVRLSFIL